MLVTLLLLLLPFVQLGVSFYASVATVMLVVVVWRWLPQIAHGAIEIWPLLLVVLFMPLQLRAAPSPDPGADLLRVLREAVMFIILVSALRGMQTAPATHREHGRLILGLLSAALVMALIQMVYFARGAYFGFPETAYAMLNGTIANDLSLRYTSDALRPHTTFSEPSYLGFVLISIGLVVVPRLDRSKLAAMSLGLVVIIGLLSRSLSFLLAFALIFGIPLVIERRKSRGVLLLGVAVLAVPLLIYLGPQMFERIFAARSATTADISISARIIGPISIISSYLVDFPAGAPFSVLDRVLAPFIVGQFGSADEILVNAVFNILFEYGLVGAVMLAFIMVAARGWRVRFYLLVAMMNNGAFLSMDKVAIVCMTVALYEGGLRRMREGEPTDPRDVAVYRPVGDRVVGQASTGLHA